MSSYSDVIIYVPWFSQVNKYENMLTALNEWAETYHHSACFQDSNTVPDLPSPIVGFVNHIDIVDLQRVIKDSLENPEVLYKSWDSALMIVCNEYSDECAGDVYRLTNEGEWI